MALSQMGKFISTGLISLGKIDQTLKINLVVASFIIKNYKNVNVD